MRLLSTMTLCLLYPVLALAREEFERPIAVVDSGGHTAPIGQLLFAPDGQSLYSVSVDRTIRVWDVRSGRTREVLRPSILGESFGQLSRAALSPDGRLLAVAGNTTRNGTSFETYLIALHPQARMQHVLKGHSAAITAVCFSANGEQLATGSLDKTVRVWTVTSGEGRVLETGKERVTGLAFSPDGKTLAVATPAGGRILSVDGSKPKVSLREAGVLYDIAWSSDAKTLAAACAAPPSLGLWNADGSFRKRLDLPGISLGCRFIAADRVLATFRVPREDPNLGQYGAVLLNLEKGGEKPPILGSVVERRFVGVEIEACCAAYAEKTNLLALAGGNDAAITLSGGRQPPESLRRILAGTGSAVWSVGWGYTGQSVAWGDEGKFEDFHRNGTRPLRYTFSFADLKLQPILEAQYQHARQAPDNPPVEGSVYSGLFYKRSSRILGELFAARCGVSLSGDLAAVASPIKSDARDPFAAHSFAIHDWHATAEKHRLEGHQGIVNALSVSRDHCYLLTGSEDQTVRIWKLGDEPRLLLSLFRGGEDWVAWTPDGCYAASASGARLLGWHVNQRDQLARLYPAADFQRSLFLPDIFKQLLPRGGVKEAIAAAKSAGADITLLPIEKVLPPEVDIIAPANETVHDSGELEIKARARAHSAEHPVTELQLLVDGRDNASADASHKVAPAENAEASWKVTLTPGEHVLTVRARTAVSTGLSAEIKITCRGAVAREPRNDPPTKKPRLHVLTIAISSAMPNAPAGRTPADNADALEKVLRERSEPLFAIQCKRLADANRQAIREEIDRLAQQLEPSDLALVLYVGPGERLADGRFFLAPHGADAKNLTATGVEMRDLRDRLSKSRGFALLLLDCYPLRRGDGRFAADSQRGVAVSDDAIREAIAGGSIAVLRSSLGESAGPDRDPPPPGLFAETVTEALAGKADHNHDGVIDLDELGDYVSTAVKKRSGGRQRPKLDCPPRAAALALTSLTKTPNVPRRDKYETVEMPVVDLPPPLPVARELPDGQTPAPEDAVLDFNLSAGSSVTINGIDHGSRTHFVFGPLRKGGLQQLELRIRLPRGKEVLRQILLRAGWHIHVSAAAEDDQPEVVVQTGHTQEIRAVTISGDGKRLLSGGKDRVAILWDIETGRQIRVFRGHTKTVQAVAFSPDGSHVLTGSEDATAILWQTESGKPVRTFKGHGDSVFAVSFHPDGKQIVTGSGDHTTIVWTADSGKKVVTLRGHKGAVHGVAFRHDGQQIVTCSADGTAILWETATGQLVHRFGGSHKPIRAVAFSPDGRHIATGSDDGTAILWDAASRKDLLTLKGHTRQINALVFNAEGTRILTGSADGTAILWSADSGKAIRTLKGHAGGVTAVAFQPKDKRVLTGSADQTVLLWELDRAEATPRAFRGTVGGVTALAIDRGRGQYVFSGSVDRMARLWDLAAGHPVKVLSEHANRVGAVALGPESRSQLTGCDDGAARLWQSADPLRQLGDTIQGKPVHAVALSPDGTKAVVGYGNGQVQLCEGASGASLRTWEAHAEGVNSIVFSSDGKSFLTASNDQAAILWDAATGMKLRAFEGHQGEVRAAALSQDGKHILTGHDSGTAILWAAGSGKQLLALPRQPDRINAVAISSDGRLLLTTAATTAILWDAGGRRLRDFLGHDGEITAAAIAPDDRLLLTASEDGTMRLWDIASGAELARLIGLEGGGDWVVLTPDGLFDGSEKGREKVMFHVSGSAVPRPVARYFDTYYRPGLLASLWRYETPAAPRRQVSKKGPPVVRIRALTPHRDGAVENPEVTLEVEATSTGGGIRGPWLKQNGSRVLSSPDEIKEAGLVIKRRFTLQLVDKDNKLEATAKSADDVESEPAVLVLRYEKPLPKPDLYLLAAGASAYKDAELRKGVKYAASDARALADVFVRRGEKGGLYRKVHSVVLLDDRATRPAIAAALEEIGRNARKEDVFVLFLAGHGVESEGRYFYIPYEFATARGITQAKLESQAVSIDDLKINLSRLQAEKRLLILDTCHSGAAVARFSSGVVPPAARLRGALEQLNTAQGIHALAAAPTQMESKEHPELEHGLFTYAVLAGLNAVESGPLRARGVRGPFVQVRDLCSFACDEAPRLYQRYFDRPQNPVMQVTGGGMSFPLLPASDP